MKNIEPTTELIIKIDNDPRRDLELFEYLDNIPLVKYIIEEENSIIRVTKNLELVFFKENEDKNKLSELFNYYIDNDYIYIRVWNIETREWDIIDYLKYLELKFYGKYKAYNLKSIYGTSLGFNYYTEDTNLTTSNDFFDDILSYYGYKRVGYKKLKS